MNLKFGYFVLSFLLSINLFATDLTLSKRQLCDLELIMNGAFDPLSGFLNESDYQSVLNNMRLSNGQVWPMPINLDVSQEFTQKVLIGDKVNLKSPEGHVLAILNIESIYKPNKEEEAQKVFNTINTEHPGVSYLFYNTKEYYIGGKVEKLLTPKHYDFLELRKTPEQLKQYFRENNITKVVAFQTRNPMHRAHLELTQRAALQADAHLLIHPAVGLTKPGDVDYFTRVKCYKKLLNYFPKNSASLALLPISMRMAGPREALWHALIRKNYGATHFIIGRDHAGPGKDSKGNDFYGPYDAQNLVQQFSKEIGIEVVPFKEMVYVPELDKYLGVDEINSNTKTLNISGTQLRKMLNDGKEIPSWFTYKEIVEELRKVYPIKSKQGFTIFFTGLSGSGKSTIANALSIKLMEVQNRPITILDGDVVRTHLSSELTFSKEHRSLNVRRIGFVANEITKNGGIAICAPIAPYEADRKYNRDLISENGGYIEVYVSTSLDECKARDEKGLYAKAEKGLIPNFTGVSDPYEVPQKSEFIIDTQKISVEESVNSIIKYLKDQEYLN